MKNIFLGICVSFLLISCANTVSAVHLENVELFNGYEIDTNGVLLKFEQLEGGRYRAHWSNSSVSTMDTLDIMSSKEVDIYLDKTNGIVIRQSCGTMCVLGVFLKFENRAQARSIQNLLGVDITKGAIVYTCNNPSKVEVCVESIKDNQVIHEIVDCESEAVLLFGLSAVKIKDNQVVITWNDANNIEKKEIIEWGGNVPE
jgi:hypothetical protein